MQYLRRAPLKISFSIALYVLSCSAQAFTWVSTPPALYYPTVNTVAGNPAGTLTLVEFFDYRCVYCRRMPALLAELLQQDPRVRLVYRDYPLLGSVSTLIAATALSAQQQGKYLALQSAFFASNAPLELPTIERLAAQQGLNVQQLERANLSYLTQQQLRENAQLAQSLHVQGIPTFFVAYTPLSTQHIPVNAIQLTAPSLAELRAALAALNTTAA